MKKAIFNLIQWFTVHLGLFKIHKQFIAKNKVTIILYHDPSPEVFEQHLQFLSTAYNIIPLQTYIDVLTGRQSSEHLPQDALIITFDDGHVGNYQLLPIIRKYNTPVTIFLCTGIIDTRKKYWFLVEGISSSSWKKVSNQSRLKALDQFGFDNNKEYLEETPQALTKEQIQEMCDLVDFQDHTLTHPILIQCEEQELVEELEKSKQAFKLKLGKEPLHFAFPNGNYSEREIQLLKQLGFQSARTTDIGINSIQTDPFRLKITGVNDTANLTQLKAELTGIPGYFYNISKGGITTKTLKGIGSNTL